MNEEKWKSVVEFPDLFEVSNLGRIWSLRTKRVLKHYVNPKGYAYLSTRIGGRGGLAVTRKVHRMVAEAFLPPPPDDIKEWADEFNKGIIPVNHKDTDKLNNRWDNLEWSTNPANSAHASDRGLMGMPKGYDNPLSLLSREDVKYIRDSYVPFSRKCGIRALARYFGISHKIIWDVVNNKRHY